MIEASRFPSRLALVGLLGITLAGGSQAAIAGSPPARAVTDAGTGLSLNLPCGFHRARPTRRGW